MILLMRLIQGRLKKQFINKTTNNCARTVLHNWYRVCVAEMTSHTSKFMQTVSAVLELCRPGILSRQTRIPFSIEVLSKVVTWFTWLNYCVTEYCAELLGQPR